MIFFPRQTGHVKMHKICANVRLAIDDASEDVVTQLARRGEMLERTESKGDGRRGKRRGVVSHFAR